MALIFRLVKHDQLSPATCCHVQSRGWPKSVKKPTHPEATQRRWRNKYLEKHGVATLTQVLFWNFGRPRVKEVWSFWIHIHMHFLSYWVKSISIDYKSFDLVMFPITKPFLNPYPACCRPNRSQVHQLLILAEQWPAVWQARGRWYESYGMGPRDKW